MDLATNALENEIGRSADGTLKLRRQLADGAVVEACVLELPYRRTSRVICVSSQAGCPYLCDFCESGHRRFVRDLVAEEIVEQVEYARCRIIDSQERRFDVTYMGIGEPLENPREVVRSFTLLLNKYPQLDRLNVSTIGPQNRIKTLSELPMKGLIHLQFSLHSPFEDERRFLFRKVLPGVRESVRDVLDFGASMNDLPCFNYLLFDGINDSRRHAKAVRDLLPRNRCYLKISYFNPIENSRLRPSPQRVVDEFVSETRKLGLDVKVFRSRGTDIQAGCGQFIASCG